MPGGAGAASPVTATPRPSPGRAPASAGPEGAAATVSAASLTVEPGAPSFELKLGDRVVPIPLSGELVRPRRGGGFTVNLERAGLAMPGLRLTELSLAATDGVPTGGTLKGDVSVPFVRGDVSLTVDAAGELSGAARLNTTVAILGNPVVDFSYADRQWQGSLTVEGSNLRLPIPNVTIADGRASIAFRGHELSGSLTARFRHAALGEGDINVSLTSAGAEGSGGFRLTMPLLAGSEGRFIFAGGELGAELDLTAAAVRLPVPGLTLSELAGHVSLARGRISGTANLGAEYAGLARVRVSDVRFGNRGFEAGRGQLDITAPALAGSGGRFSLSRDGGFEGRIIIASDRIPIPAIRRGQVVITFRPDGGIDVAGEGEITLSRIARADLYVRYEAGALSLGAQNVVLTARVPGIERIEGSLEYSDGQIQGSLETAVVVGPLSGRVLLVYRDRILSGEGRLAYEMGRFSGWVLARVSPEGQFSGEGEAQFRLTDWLTGRIGLVLHPDLNVDARGELVFTDQITLFDPWEFEQNFFNFEQEFPLWGITIPIIGSIGIIAEVHANAGFRARFGPGTLRNIRAVGEISTRPGVEPAFEISGDFNIPAGAEIVLVVGGGIGLSALVAKISGGLDLEGIAGVYGAITLTPTFAYRDGKYQLRGDALLEAAAQLRARINAYARIRAGIGPFMKTVWSENWNLAEWIFDTGWNVGVRASLAYTLGEPFVPQIRFDEVAVNPTDIIRAAVPDSGRPVPAPPHAPAPTAEFRPEAGTVADVAAGPAPGGMPAAPAPAGAAPGSPAVEPPAGGPVPEPTATPAGEPTIPAGEAPVGPTVEPPEAVAEQPEERSVEETYLVYVYDQLDRFFHRQKRDTAPADEALRRKALEEADKKKGPVPEREQSAGRPLSPGVREKMETIFQEDFSDVRVHTDENARESAKDWGAEAYAVGRDVYFGPSREPEAGQEDLLAHELTHVAQGAGDGSDRVSRPSDELEREAEEAGDAVRRGEPPRPIRKKEGTAGIHRAESDGGARVDAAARVKFTKEQWRDILASPALQADPAFRTAVSALLSEEQVAAQAKQNIYDQAVNAFKARQFVPMRFPGPEYLGHRSVFGDPQIQQGQYLIREGGEREDTNQNLLSALMYARDRHAAAFEEVGTAGDLFSRSEAGTYDKEQLWASYQTNPLYQSAKAADRLNSSPAPTDVAAQKTTGSEHNLSLDRAGFDQLWASVSFIARDRGCGPNLQALRPRGDRKRGPAVGPTALPGPA
jgi:hypothetical protein